MLSAISQFRVDLIGQHQDISIPQNFRNRLQIFSGHNAAGGIVRIGQDQHLCAFCDMGTQFLRCQLELVFQLGGDRNCYTVHQFHDRFIANERRLYDQNFISRIDGCTNRKIDCLRTAHCNQCFVFRMISQVVLAVQIMTDLFSQICHTGIGSVHHAFPFQTVHGSFSYCPRCLKVRLSDTQTDHTLHHGSQIEKFPDTRGLHFLYLI